MNILPQTHTLLTGLAIACSLVMSPACYEDSSELLDPNPRQDQNVIPDYQQVTLEDVTALDPEENIILDLSQDVVYVIAAEVWADYAEMVLLSGSENELSLAQWKIEISELGAELYDGQSLSVAKHPSFFLLSDNMIAELEENEVLVTISETYTYRRNGSMSSCQKTTSR